MILLWGLLEDDTMRSVHDRLRAEGAQVLFVNHAAIRDTRLRVSSRPSLSYELLWDDQSYRLEEMSAAYLRPYNPRDYDDGDADQVSPPGAGQPELFHHLMNLWADNSPALVINRPAAEASNHSKLAQAVRIEAAGFSIPASLVTNSAERAREFQASHGRVIYKSMSSVRSIVRELDPDELETIGAMGPVLFQQHIAGQNIRAHVIGEQVLACAIQSEAVDYRYAPASLEDFELPAQVAARCIALVRGLGLVLAGLDLILTERGEWYCLEVNPNPAFSFFDVTGQGSIARLVAERLMEAQAQRTG